MDHQVTLNLDKDNGVPTPIWPIKIQLSSYIGDMTDSVPSIREKLYTYSTDNLNYGGGICFCRVPEKYRDNHEDAYNPRLVSIGFIHHGKSQLRGMEGYKFKYLNHFLDTFRVTLNALAEFVRNQENYVCDCYEENPRKKLLEKFNITPHEVILLDGIFIVELLLKNHFIQLRENEDIIFDQVWVSNDILHDLLLFENQLPLQFLRNIYNTFVSGKTIQLVGAVINPPPFSYLVHEYFKDVGFRGNQLLNRDFDSARHFTEFLSILNTPNKYRQCTISDRREPGMKPKRPAAFTTCPTAIELKTAGVRFQSGKGEHLLVVDFVEKTGVLTLPPVVVNDSMEAFLRSLIAYEQFPYHPNFITSYVHLLDNLIDTEEDVEILIRQGIIVSEFDSYDEVLRLFNTHYKELLTNSKDFYYAEQCDQLYHYRRDMFHAAKLRFAIYALTVQREYFNTPWSLINFTGGILIVIALTVVQTVCSLIQVKQGQH